ncbi:YdcF family protein [Dyella solisilvae]|uniref:YdcF family protein n=1 Tax=Dyella solisilvae TaxID=1920168 RepID=A0A370K530_9GAMM|nr:YdcF family protein [Dyella solisilvae]RDI97120.1 YdcF family protein [Dyella solisilvae]
MLTLLFAMLLLAALLYRWRWRRAGHVLVGLAVVVLFAVGCGTVPHMLLRDLQSPYDVEPAIDWAPRNAIVLLSGGTTVAGDEPLQVSYFADGRVLRAAQLYYACKQTGKECRVLAVGGDSQDHGEAESVVYGRALRKLGIPASDLSFETRSLTTWQNAQFSRPILAELAPQHMVLVTSGIHLRRALLYFAHFGITPQPVAGDWLNSRRELLPDSWNYVVTDAILHEYAGIVRYRVYNLLGWNAPKAPPLTQ